MQWLITTSTFFIRIVQIIIISFPLSKTLFLLSYEPSLTIHDYIRVSNMAATDMEAAMEEVNLRRVLRGEQRDLEDSIVNTQLDDGGTGSDINVKVVNDYRNHMNNLFENVVHTREQLQDAEVLKALSKKVSINSTKLSQNQAKYDFVSFVDGLTSKFNEPTVQQQSKRLNWAALGRNVMPLFLATPCYRGFASHIDKEIIQKEARRASRVREDLGPEAKPMEVRQTLENEAELNEASSSRIQKLHEVVQDIHECDLLSLLVDSRDPVQSVENFFDYAFLIKDKKVAIEPTDGSSAAPQTCSVDIDDVGVGDGEEEEDSSAVVKKQHVLSLGIKDLKRIGQMLELLNDNEASQASSSQRSGSQNKSQSQRTPQVTPSPSSQGDSSQLFNPIRRFDPLYEIGTAGEQAQFIETNKQKKMKHNGKSVATTPAAAAASAAASSSSSSSSNSSSATGKRKRG